MPRGAAFLAAEQKHAYCLRLLRFSRIIEAGDIRVITKRLKRAVERVEIKF